MLKKIYNLLFIISFMAIISVPVLFADRQDSGISAGENRTLASRPSLIIGGKFNDNYTKEYETWFMDHLGFRDKLINLNAKFQYYLFGNMLSQSEYHIGRAGDINYATDSIMLDYSHLNLRSSGEVEKIGRSYQTVNDWLSGKGIQFYYVQCWDKQTVYPEQFLKFVNQYGNISKTDQVISYLRNSTTVNTISLKEELIASKNKHEVYSNWGDPTHWSERGAYTGYRYIMDKINQQNNNMYKVLDEDDYDITVSDKGITLNGFIHKEDMLESFVIKNPYAGKADKSPMGKYAEDARHSLWKNSKVKNDTKLLLMCDSYINSFIVEDIAESFSEVWLVWGDYTSELDEVIKLYEPDIVIYECAERVDRSQAVVLFADKIKNN
ncbi:MAG: hypothetical protein K1W06_06400 [Lachnospiraceae bacterium]